MPHAEVNGQQIFFEDTGGDGPAVILAHGFLTNPEPVNAAIREFLAALAN